MHKLSLDGILTWALCAALLASSLATAVVARSAWMATREFPGAAEAWRRHREACRLTPDEAYRKDRARALRGTVRDGAGKPVSGAVVRLLRLSSLHALVQAGPPTPASWSGLVEVETRTAADGRYEFPYLEEGARTICVSAPAHAPAVESLIVVQDGSGPRVDVELEATRTLRIALENVGARGRRIHLVPYRWWPEPLSRDVEGGASWVDFDGLGGPFRKGLILVSEPGKSSSWALAGTYDLDRASEVEVNLRHDFPASRVVVPELACLKTGDSKLSEASRHFFGVLTPVVLFWQADVPPEPVPPPSVVTPHAPPAGIGGLRGYGPGAFLPVLIEARGGGAWLEWTSSASEFELKRVPAGLYRVRALGYSGSVLFARGLVVGDARPADLATRLGDPIDLDEPMSREVMGIVRWEDGQPVKGAAVFLQDTVSFRRFLSRVETDKNGYYRIPNVPGDAEYLAFVLPPDDPHAMKHFVYSRIPAARREVWIDLTASPHRVSGRAGRFPPNTRLQLVRQEPDGQERVLWTTSTEEAGEFAITNVPHGRYYVRTVGGRRPAGTASLAFDVGRDTSVVVPWPESRPPDPSVGPSR